MRFKTEIRDGVAVVRLAGRFVTGSDADLVCVKNHLEEAGIFKAILDFEDVPYIDSTGLAFVVELHKAMKSRGGQVLLANANAKVREVLALTRIQEIIPFADHADSIVLRDEELTPSC